VSSALVCQACPHFHLAGSSCPPAAHRPADMQVGWLLGLAVLGCLAFWALVALGVVALVQGWRPW
jgi:hypothetical protein